MALRVASDPARCGRRESRRQRRKGMRKGSRGFCGRGHPWQWAETRAARNVARKVVSQVHTSAEAEGEDSATDDAAVFPRAAMRPARTILPAPVGSEGNALASSCAGVGSSAFSSGTRSDSTSSARRDRESASSFVLPGRKRQLKLYSESVSHRRTCRRVCFGGCAQYVFSGS